jgi:hypothetical protein
MNPYTLLVVLYTSLASKEINIEVPQNQIIEQPYDLLYHFWAYKRDTHVCSSIINNSWTIKSA